MLGMVMDWVCMRRVIHDLTYALGGKSGISKDTRSVAEILENYVLVQGWEKLLHRLKSKLT